MRTDPLGAIPTRLAVEGQELVVHTFLDGSTGFTFSRSVQRFHRQRRDERSGKTVFRRIMENLLHIARRAPPVPAIYVPDCTRLILKRIPSEIQHQYGIQSEEGAVLVERGGRLDHLRFANDRQILLRDLPEGIALEVLSLAETEYALCEQELEMQA